MENLREISLEDWNRALSAEHEDPTGEPIEDLEAWTVNLRLSKMLPGEILHFGEIRVDYVQASRGSDANFEIRHRGVHTLVRRMDFERARAYVLMFGTV